MHQLCIHQNQIVKQCFIALFEIVTHIKWWEQNSCLLFYWTHAKILINSFASINQSDSFLLVVENNLNIVKWKIHSILKQNYRTQFQTEFCFFQPTIYSFAISAIVSGLTLYNFTHSLTQFHISVSFNLLVRLYFFLPFFFIICTQFTC